jgi:hypothetical protein
LNATMIFMDQFRRAHPHHMVFKTTTPRCRRIRQRASYGKGMAPTTKSSSTKPSSKGKHAAASGGSGAAAISSASVGNEVTDDDAEEEQGEREGGEVDEDDAASGTPAAQTRGRSPKKTADQLRRQLNGGLAPREQGLKSPTTAPGGKCRAFVTVVYVLCVSHKCK